MSAGTIVCVLTEVAARQPLTEAGGSERRESGAILSSQASGMLWQVGAAPYPCAGACRRVELEHLSAGL